MTSPRQREVEYNINVRCMIIFSVFLCFYIPFAYFWAWMLEPLDQAVIWALGFGAGGSMLLYIPWMRYGDRLDRLRKYQVIFNDFFEAMITDMEANDEEKGDSWLTMDIVDLQILIDRKWTDLLSDSTRNDPLQDYPKLGNYCAMIYLRERYADEEAKAIENLHAQTYKKVNQGER